MDESKDSLSRRCPRMGGPVSFNYCRTCGDDGLPCFKTTDCWWEYFDVMSFLKENLPEEKLALLLASKPQPKIPSLIDLIARTKKNIK